MRIVGLLVVSAVVAMVLGFALRELREKRATKQRVAT